MLKPLLFLAMMSFSVVARAEIIPEPVSAYVPAAAITGQARMTYMFFDVYDAALYAPEGRWSAEGPYALTLTYLRNINGRAIADRSAEEMRGQGFADEIKLAAWHGQMLQIFPDVKNGTKLTGIHVPGQETRFYQDGVLIGRVRDPDFGRHFFGIWLSQRSSAPQLRARLLAGNATR